MRRPEDRKVRCIDPRLPPAEYDRLALMHMKAKCIVTASGCWEIQSTRHASKGMNNKERGYGDFSYRGKNYRAHRIAYQLAKGPIPPGYVVAHSCDNPPCCNPDHLSAKTELENAAEMIEKRRNYEQRRTECPKGHPYNEQNTRYVRAKSGRMARACRACDALKAKSPSYVAWRREYQRSRRAQKRVQRSQELS